MKIKGIDLTKLRNAEFIQFIRQTIEFTKEKDLTVLPITDQLTQLEGKLAVLETLQKQEKANALTQEIEELDNLRDNAIKGISFITAGYTYSDDTAVKEAAITIQNSIKSYGYGSGIAKLNYNAQTATVISILNNWEENVSLSNAITLLKLTTFKESLKNANMAFNTLYKERIQQYAADNPENLKGIRLETIPLYYEFRDYLVAYETINSTQIGKELISQLNALIDQYNVLLTARYSKTIIDDDAENLDKLEE
ncbi:conserved hypothetical protein [Tenacibaculum sp. 190524A02b]|uniref:Uncharacterized protein n=1 Tax=Tenacibaculum vairaonense TaxID=3137860 RepID=A0ABM9PQF9_9FLAO